jgi:hypothetical protein
MQKALALFGLLVALALMAIFGMDVAMGDPKAGTGWPFLGFSKAMDIGFIIAAVILAYISFATFRELP